MLPKGLYQKKQVKVVFHNALSTAPTCNKDVKVTRHNDITKYEIVSEDLAKYRPRQSVNSKPNLQLVLPSTLPCFVDGEPESKWEVHDSTESIKSNTHFKRKINTKKLDQKVQLPDESRSAKDKLNSDTLSSLKTIFKAPLSSKELVNQPNKRGKEQSTRVRSKDSSKSQLDASSSKSSLSISYPKKLYDRHKFMDSKLNKLPASREQYKLKYDLSGTMNYKHGKETCNVVKNKKISNISCESVEMCENVKHKKELTENIRLEIQKWKKERCEYGQKSTERNSEGVELDPRGKKTGLSGFITEKY